MNIEIVNLKGRVSHRGLIIAFHALDEEGVMIRELRTTIDLKKADYWLPVFENDFGGSQRQVLGIPIVHLSVSTVWTSHTVMTPAMYESWIRPGTVRFSLSRLVIFVVNDRFF